MEIWGKGEWNGCNSTNCHAVIVTYPDSKPSKLLEHTSKEQLSSENDSDTLQTTYIKSTIHKGARLHDSGSTQNTLFNLITR